MRILKMLDFDILLLLLDHHRHIFRLITLRILHQAGLLHIINPPVGLLLPADTAQNGWEVPLIDVGVLHIEVVVGQLVAAQLDRLPMVHSHRGFTVHRVELDGDVAAVVAVRVQPHGLDDDGEGEVDDFEGREEDVPLQRACESLSDSVVDHPVVFVMAFQDVHTFPQFEGVVLVELQKNGLLVGLHELLQHSAVQVPVVEREEQGAVDFSGKTVDLQPTDLLHFEADVAG